MSRENWRTELKATTKKTGGETVSTSMQNWATGARCKGNEPKIKLK